MKQELQTIEFYGNDITVVMKESELYVAMKPICESIGIQWEAQFKRIKRNPVLIEGMSIMDIPSNGGIQKIAMLEMSMLHGWLFGINTSRVKLNVKDKLITYQKECFAVLHEYWQNKIGKGVNKKNEGHNKTARFDDLQIFMEITRQWLPIGTVDRWHSTETMHTAMVLQHLYQIEGDGLQIQADVHDVAKTLSLSSNLVCDAIDKIERNGLLLKKLKSGSTLWIVLLRALIKQEKEASVERLFINNGLKQASASNRIMFFNVNTMNSKN